MDHYIQAANGGGTPDNRHFRTISHLISEENKAMTGQTLQLAE